MFLIFPSKKGFMFLDIIKKQCQSIKLAREALKATYSTLCHKNLFSKYDCRAFSLANLFLYQNVR